jgi:predicted ABC-type exoprotein transport system permease subunit
MSRKDYLKEEIGVLKEEYRNIFLIFLAVGTGSFASFYQVLLSVVPIWIAVVGIAGIVLTLFVAIMIQKKRHDIDAKLSELEEME